MTLGHAGVVLFDRGTQQYQGVSGGGGGRRSHREKNRRREVLLVRAK